MYSLKRLFILFSLLSPYAHSANIIENILYAHCDQGDYRYEVHTRETDLKKVTTGSSVDVYQFKSGENTEMILGTVTKSNDIKLPGYWVETTLENKNCTFSQTKASPKRQQNKTKGSKKSGAVVKMDIVNHFIPMNIDITKLTHDEYNDYVSDKTILFFQMYVYCELAASTKATGPCQKITMPDQEVYPL